MTPSQTKTAHDAIHLYRLAVDDAERAAKALQAAAVQASEAAQSLQPYVDSPIPAIAWTGAPPVAEWRAGVEALILDVKAALQVSS